MPTEPRRTLLVIDVQNEYVDGRLRIEQPPVHGSLARIAQAVDAAHAHGVPVVVVQNVAPEGAPLFARGSRGQQLHEVVASRRHSHRVVKSLPSAFADTDLAAWLGEHRIDTVALAGYMTHNCVAATAFDALHRGLAVECLSDATGSVPYRNEAGDASAQTIHQVFGIVLQSRFAAVVSTSAWIDAVRAKQPLPRGSIFASHEAALAAR